MRIIILLLTLLPFTARADVTQANECLQSVRIATTAYVSATGDMMYPNFGLIEQRVEFFGSESPFPYDKEVAKYVAKSIATTLMTLNMHRPNEFAIDYLTNEIAKLCRDML